MTLKYYNYIKINTLFLSIILFLNCFCSSNKNIKPNPDTENYELCPFCKGYGVIESYSSAPPQKGVELNEDEKKFSDFCVDIVDEGFCLFSIFDLSKKKESQVPDSSEYAYRDNEHREREKFNYRVEEDAGRAYVKKTVRCLRCKGAGWVKKSDNSANKQIDDSQYIEGIQKANEMIKD